MNDETENKHEKGHNNSMKEDILNQREDYFKELRSWLDNARLWQNISGNFPYINSENSEISGNSTDNAIQTLRNRFNGQQLVWDQHFLNNLQLRFPIPPGQNNFHNILFAQTFPFRNTHPTRFEFIIPPLWKRIAAEFIDFLILFVVKLGITFILMESFNFINLDFYGLESFQKNLENPDLAVELLTLEFLHRLVVCAFETYFLRGQVCATPGKRCMGLMVIKVDTLTLVAGRAVETVTVTGAMPLGWQKSLSRSILKNLIVGLLLPWCITFYIFPHNRTSYDMMTNTLVVESNPDFLMHQRVM